MSSVDTGGRSSVPWSDGGRGVVASLDSDIKQKMGHLKKVMAEQSDGKVIKRTLSAKLRKIAKPLEQQMRTRVLRLPSKGHPGPSMRQAVARQTRAATRWSGDNMGVSVVQRARGMPRDFRMAGRAFNRSEGWRPTTLGGVSIHQEMRPVGWFDGATPGVRPDAQREILQALDEAAATIAARVK